MSSDALDLIRMSPTGAVSAMQAALDYGKISPNHVDYINAHGTGTVLNDVTESQAIEEVFGEHSKELLVSSTKSMHGHALGAAGALEFVATVKAIETECVPPTANLDVVDPECRLDYVPGSQRRHQIRAALSNAFAFGGTNAVIALRKFSQA
jgi:nodulation protein E